MGVGQNTLSKNIDACGLAKAMDSVFLRESQK